MKIYVNTKTIFNQITTSFNNHRNSEPNNTDDDHSGLRWSIRRPRMGDIRRLSPPGLKDVKFKKKFTFEICKLFP